MCHLLYEGDMAPIANAMRELCHMGGSAPKAESTYSHKHTLALAPSCTRSDLHMLRYAGDTAPIATIYGIMATFAA